jgi:hypothetical protein
MVGPVAAGQWRCLSTALHSSLDVSCGMRHRGADFGHIVLGPFLFRPGGFQSRKTRFTPQGHYFALCYDGYDWRIHLRKILYKLFGLLDRAGAQHQGEEKRHPNRFDRKFKFLCRLGNLEFKYDPVKNGEEAEEEKDNKHTLLQNEEEGRPSSKEQNELLKHLQDRVSLLTALMFPGIVFGFFVLLNLVAMQQRSSLGVPFITILVLLFLWFVVNMPLLFCGARIAYRRDVIKVPGAPVEDRATAAVSTADDDNHDQVASPRLIPCQPCYLQGPLSLAGAGILPFFVCCKVETFYILGGLWQGHYYYSFGFLLLVFFPVIAVAAKITMVCTFLQLCGENYHWWWRAFGSGGSTGLWLFLYSLVYFHENMEVNQFLPSAFYFGYMGWVSLGLFLMLGFIGVSSALWLNKIIYRSMMETKTGDDDVELIHLPVV